MSFFVTSEFKKIAKITLAGELDSLSARTFQAEIEKVATEAPDELILFVEQLAFMSSAGLRVLIFAKQKIGPHLSLIIVKPQESIVDTLEKTGLLHSVSVVDSYV